MKKRYRLVIGAASALGVGFGVDTGIHALEASFDAGTTRATEMIESCAPALGDVAVQSVKLPAGCEDTAGYIPYRANVVEDVDYQQRPSLYDSGVTQVSEDRVYTVPSRHDFEAKMQKFVEDDEALHLTRKRITIGVVSVLSLTVGWCAYSISGYKRQKTTPESDAEGE